MVLYNCPTCNKEFKKKCNYDYHIGNKKKPCNPTSIIIPPKSSVIPPKSSEFSQKSDNIIDILMDKPLVTDNENKCVYCDKIFTRIDNLQRHLNGRCKSKGNYDDLEKLKEDMKVIIKNYQKLENNYQNLENNYQNLENVNVNLKKEIDGIKTTQQGSCDNTTVINKTINNNNNNQINKGVILNNTVNIQVVQFGSEDIDKLNLTDAMKSYLKSTGGNIASNMLKYINLNEQYPENNNICMTDLSREIVKIHNGKKFVYKKFKNVKGDILNKVVGNTRKLITKYKNDETLKISNDIKNKLKINDVSLKIIDGISAEDIVREEINEQKVLTEANNVKINKINEKKDVNSDSDSEEEREFTFEERLRIEHLENKREGMQKITFENIKDGLYNAKELLEKNN